MWLTKLYFYDIHYSYNIVTNQLESVINKFQEGMQMDLVFRIIQWITASEQWNCTDCAHMLLKDGVLVSKYEKEYKEFVRMILRLRDCWLT